MEPTDTPYPGYETRDVRFSRVLGFAVALAALVLVAVVAMRLFLGGMAAGGAAAGPVHALAEERTVPPGPRLQIEPSDAVSVARSLAESRLGRYAWIDREGGVIQIPIERAMELLLERGFPLPE